MQPFDLNLLLMPSLVIFLATLWVTQKLTRSVITALLAAFIKAGLFLLYYGFLFDGTFTFKDDWVYLEGGQTLYRHGVGLTNLAENWNFALMVGHGEHFVYYLYNTYAIRIFGAGYYAPIAMNTLLTLAIAWIGTRLAVREFKLQGAWPKRFFLFLLLHPDILAWSTVMNGKDICVLLLHVLLLAACSLFFRQRVKAALMLAVPVSLVLFFMRFYVPLLFTVALLTSLLFGRTGGQGRLRLFLVSAALVVLVLFAIGLSDLQFISGQLQRHFVNPLYGFPRFILTPIPFNTAPAFGFLNLPATIHWLLIPFACWGIVQVSRLRTKFSRFYLVYILIFTCLSAVFGAGQGPRHRVQLDYAWAVLQFVGVMSVLRTRDLQRSTIKARPRVYRQPQDRGGINVHAADLRPE